MNIGIIANIDKDSDLTITEKVIERISATESVSVSEDIHFRFPHIPSVSGDALYKEQDLLLVLGGDGTLLHAAHHAAPFDTPVLGINLGHVGFLSGAEKEDFFYGDIPSLLGQIRIEERMMLEARVCREGAAPFAFHGLNDAVVRGQANQSLLRMSVSVDQKPLGAYIADGIVFSTPTGSTAYSFSAGGAVVHPGMEALLVTPICPHMLHARPVVLPGDSLLTAHFLPDSARAYLVVDGEDRLHLEEGDRVEIRRAPYTAKIATLQRNSFLEILKEKLKG